MKTRMKDVMPVWPEEESPAPDAGSEDELINREDIWHFYCFVASTVVPLLEDFLEVADFKSMAKGCTVFTTLPENCVSSSVFRKMVSSIRLLIRYRRDEGLKYKGRKIDFERGDMIPELTDALHLLVNILPYLNDRHFEMSRERYESSVSSRECSFDELRNLDKTIARRILPTLEVFASSSVFYPRHFKMTYCNYPLPYSERSRKYMSAWDKALKAMVESWRWILERVPTVNPDGWENVPEKVFYGLHLFAEYLPEMQND